MPTLRDLRPINVVYEDGDNLRNLTAHGRWVTPDTRLVHDTWVHAEMLHGLSTCRVYGVEDRPSCYLYPIGCFNAPHDWGGQPIIGATDGPVLLDHAPSEILEDARQGRVLIVLDQSQEGNANPQLWSWMHAHLLSHGIPASSVMYLTSDQLAEADYLGYRNANGISHGMHVISSWFNQHAMQRMLSLHPVVAKSDPHPGPKRLFNCLNRMPHAHRKDLWLQLWRSGLLSDGLISMPCFDTGDAAANALLPMMVDIEDFTINHFNQLNADIYARSVLSIVTETYVDDRQLLIGEKVFKPMWCGHPFMILGTRGTLARLREQGFMTFGRAWDESYDDLADPADRIAAIVAQLSWLRSLSDPDRHIDVLRLAVQHNQRMVRQSWDQSKECAKMVDIYHKMLA